MEESLAETKAELEKVRNIRFGAYVIRAEALKLGLSDALIKANKVLSDTDKTYETLANRVHFLMYGR